MPKLYTYLYTPYPINDTQVSNLHIVSIIAISDEQARDKLNLSNLIFVSQKPIRGAH